MARPSTYVSRAARNLRAKRGGCTWGACRDWWSARQVLRTLVGDHQRVFSDSTPGMVHYLEAQWCAYYWTSGGADVRVVQLAAVWEVMQIEGTTWRLAGSVPFSGGSGAGDPTLTLRYVRVRNSSAGQGGKNDTGCATGPL